MVFAVNDDRGCNLNPVVSQNSQPLLVLLKQAFVAGETKKLIWETGTQQGPEGACQNRRRIRQG